MVAEMRKATSVSSITSMIWGIPGFMASWKIAATHEEMHEIHRKGHLPWSVNLLNVLIADRRTFSSRSVRSAMNWGMIGFMALWNTAATHEEMHEIHRKAHLRWSANFPKTLVTDPRTFSSRSVRSAMNWGMTGFIASWKTAATHKEMHEIHIRSYLPWSINLLNVLITDRRTFSSRSARNTVNRGMPGFMVSWKTAVTR
jgi:hypothetical protein